MEMASNLYRDEDVSISFIEENAVLVEATCSLGKAIQLIEMDKSEGERSIDLRR